MPRELHILCIAPVVLREHGSRAHQIPRSSSGNHLKHVHGLAVSADGEAGSCRIQTHVWLCLGIEVGLMSKRLERMDLTVLREAAL